MKVSLLPEVILFHLCCNALPCSRSILKQFCVRLQRLSYAKGESDAVAKIKGTFVEKDKKERQKHNKIERGASVLSCQHLQCDTLRCLCLASCIVLAQFTSTGFRAQIGLWRGVRGRRKEHRLLQQHRWYALLALSGFESLPRPCVRRSTKNLTANSAYDAHCWSADAEHD